MLTVDIESVGVERLEQVISARGVEYEKLTRRAPPPGKRVVSIAPSQQW